MIVCLILSFWLGSDQWELSHLSLVVRKFYRLLIGCFLKRHSDCLNFRYFPKYQIKIKLIHRVTKEEITHWSRYTCSKYLLHNRFTRDVSIKVYLFPKSTRTGSSFLNATKAISYPGLTLRFQRTNSPKSQPGLTP